MAHPISGKHAIEVAVFIVAFERPFSQTSIDALMGLKESLHSSYPSFSPMNALEVRVEGENIERSESRISGVFLQNHKQDGRPSWSLRASENNIVISCFDYEKWETTSDKAINDLCSATVTAVDDKNPLAVVAFQVLDRWSGPSCRDEYKLSQVFNTRSPFLTKQASLSGCLWHVHQGWFENPPPEHKGQILHVLNLSTNDTPTGIITTIDHTARIHFAPSIPAAQSTQKDFLSDVFKDLHDRNKKIVKELVNSKQCKAIGIC